MQLICLPHLQTSTCEHFCILLGSFLRQQKQWAWHVTQQSREANSSKQRNLLPDSRRGHCKSLHKQQQGGKWRNEHHNTKAKPSKHVPPIDTLSIPSLENSIATSSSSSATLDEPPAPRMNHAKDTASRAKAADKPSVDGNRRKHHRKKFSELGTTPHTIIRRNPSIP